MSYTEAFKELYKKCKEMDLEDSIELALNAESEEERDFVELVSNFIMQSRQKEVIAKGKF